MSENSRHSANNPGYSASHIGKGRAYQEGFRNQVGRRLIWELEQDLLLAECNKWAPDFRFLDFACGTGRISALLASHGGRAHGIDISRSMIEVARSNLEDGLFVCADFRAAEVKSRVGGDFDLVTAFRFFSNAEESLRKEALRFIHQALGRHGIAIVNIHRNCSSIGFRAQKLARKPEARRCYSPSDFEALVADSGLVVTQRISQGFLVLSDKRIMLPAKLQFLIEQILGRSSLKRSLLGFNVVYTLALADA